MIQLIYSLLYGGFNKILNWTCGIMGTFSVPVLFITGNKEGAWQVLWMTLAVLGMKLLLEAIKVGKEVWPIVLWAFAIFKKRKEKDNGTDITKN